MRKKYSKSQLQALEREMKDSSKWKSSDHTVSYRGPTSIRFPLDTLKKLQAIAKATQKPVNRLVNEFVKPFVDGEYALLERMK